MIDDIILVTGMLRSGISIIGGILDFCDVWGGQFPVTSRFDVRGSFENTSIRDSIVRPFLRGIGADPSGQRPLPEIRRCERLAPLMKDKWRRRVETVIQSQGYKEGSVFFVNAQTALLWPIWKSAFPQARWILVRRNIKDVIRSCMLTGYMMGYDTREGWQKWSNIYEQRFLEILNMEAIVYEIWPQKIIDGDLRDMRELTEGLGLSWHQQGVEDFISPLLWKKGVFEVTKN